MDFGLDKKHEMARTLFKEFVNAVGVKECYFSPTNIHLLITCYIGLTIDFSY